MGFCTIADIAAFLQITITPASPAALRAINEATAAIQTYTHQRLEVIEGDVITFDVRSRQKRLFLPQIPVLQVSEVVEDGEILVAGTDYALGNYGILSRESRRFWIAGYGKVTVTYDHGHATLPQTIVDVCTRAAARSYQAGLRAADSQGVAGIAGMSLGDYQVQYSSEQSGGVSGGALLGSSAAPLLLPSEKAMLNYWRFAPAPV